MKVFPLWMVWSPLVFIQYKIYGGLSLSVSAAKISVLMILKTHRQGIVLQGVGC